MGRVGVESLQRLSDDSLRRFLPPLPYPEASTAYKQKFSETMAQLAGPAPPDKGADEAARSMNNGGGEGGGCPHIGTCDTRIQWSACLGAESSLPPVVALEVRVGPWSANGNVCKAWS